MSAGKKELKRNKKMVLFALIMNSNQKHLKVWFLYPLNLVVLVIPIVPQTNQVNVPQFKTRILILK